MGRSNPVSEGLQIARTSINQTFANTEPWKLILFTAVAAWGVKALNDARYGDISLRDRIKKSFYRLVRSIPAVRAEISKSLVETKQSVRKDIGLHKTIPGEKCRVVLPAKGLPADEVLKETAFLESMGSTDWRGGRVSGTVYHGGQELTDLVTKVFGQFCWDNPLHPDVFPGTRKMEAEVIRMCADLYHGGPEACGAMTSGGTESILMAVKAHRDYAREVRGIEHPNIVLPRSAHVAFHKAAHYFRIRVKYVDSDPVTGKGIVSQAARLVDCNTIMLVASAPSFPHGIIDDVEAFAKIALKKGCGLHVDCCLGGFLLPFMEEAGFTMPKFDFRVKGVTSISMDTHKYGYCPKGTSVVLYANAELRHYQYHSSTEWPGGIYVSPTVAGSRPGSLIAATWATLMFFGRQGYVDSTRKIIETRRRIQDGVARIPGLRVIGDPQMSVLALTSDDFDIYRLTQTMTERGWNLNVLQYPASFHICVTMVHTQEGVADAFLRDLKAIAEELMADPAKKCTGGVGAIYGMASGIPDRSIVDTIAYAYLDVVYEAKEPAAEEAAA